MDRYPYRWYTILLEAKRALAHIGIHFTHRVFSLLSFWRRCRGKVYIDIENNAIRYYSKNFFFVCFTSAGNLVLLVVV